MTTNSAIDVGSSQITTLGTISTGVWQGTAITVANGGTGNTTFTAYSVICAGTSSTGTFQNVSGVGTSGQLLTSNGASALPTWQAAGGAGGSVASAYANFSSMSSSPPTINQELNISSITRSGTGLYVIDFTNSYSAATYPIITGYNRANNTGVAYCPNVYSLSTGGFDVAATDSTGSAIDPTNFFFASYGS